MAARRTTMMATKVLNITGEISEDWLSSHRAPQSWGTDVNAGVSRLISCQTACFYEEVPLTRSRPAAPMSVKFSKEDTTEILDSRVERIGTLKFRKANERGTLGRPKLEIEERKRLFQTAHKMGPRTDDHSPWSFNPRRRCFQSTRLRRQLLLQHC